MTDQPNRPGDSGKIAPRPPSDTSRDASKSGPEANPEAKLSGRQLWGAIGLGLAAVSVAVGLVWLVFDPYGHDAWADWVRSIILGLGFVGAVPAGYIAYRKQKSTEADHQLDRDKYDLEVTKEERRQQERDDSNRRAAAKDYRDRFVTITAQLGSDRTAIRLAGVYALAQLADEWGETEPEQRQTCIEVLCAYLGIPGAPQRLDIQGVEAARPKSITIYNYEADERRVRDTVIDIVSKHCRSIANRSAPYSWGAYRINIVQATLPGLQTYSMQFTTGALVFDGCTLTDRLSLLFAELHDFSARQAVLLGEISFQGSSVTGSFDLGFSLATRFANLSGLQFHGGVNLAGASFAGGLKLSGSEFHDEQSLLQFRSMTIKGDMYARGALLGGPTFFDRSTFLGNASFTDTVFLGDANFFGIRVEGTCDFRGVHFTKECNLNASQFYGASVSFLGAVFEQAPQTEAASVIGTLIHPDGTRDPASDEPRPLVLRWQLDS